LMPTARGSPMVGAEKIVAMFVYGRDFLRPAR
jgi:hypothetical protein